MPSEFGFLPLRLTEGVDLVQYKQFFNIDLQTKFAEELNYLSETGLVECENKRLKLTKKGMLFSNEVFSVFV